MLGGLFLLEGAAAYLPGVRRYTQAPATVTFLLLGIRLQRRMVCWARELHHRNGNLSRSGLWPLGFMLLRIVSGVTKEDYPCNKPMSTTNRGERLRWRCGVTETIT